MVMTFTIIGFCISLRGEEVPLVAIDGLLEFWEETKAHTTPYMMITLRCKFKGENNLRWHCVPLADVTKSGIPTQRWISRMMNRQVVREGARGGYLFATKSGKKANLGDYDPMFRDYMEKALKLQPDLFSQAVSVNEYSIWYSLHRGATTEAKNNNVDLVAPRLDFL